MTSGSTPVRAGDIVKQDLHDKLREVRAGLLSRLEGLSEYDVRRPSTPTGTNLLGLVKHMIAVEHVYLGTSFGRPPAEAPPWVTDDSIRGGADMWATADESREEILARYADACAHADRTIDELDLDTPGRVPHWPAAGADTTLSYLLVRMVAETAQHAGHADIVRERLDGRAGDDHDMFDEAGWNAYLATIQAAADHFR